MKRLAALLTALALLLLGAWIGGELSSASAGHHEGSSDSLTYANEMWQKYATAVDATGLASLYADDAYLLPPGMAPVKGRTAIESALNDMFAEATFASLTIHSDHVVVAGSGELAYQLGRFDAMMEMADGSTAPDKGKYLSVLKKIDGKWMFVADIWNSD